MPITNEALLARLSSRLDSLEAEHRELAEFCVERDLRASREAATVRALEAQLNTAILGLELVAQRTAALEAREVAAVEARASFYTERYLGALKIHLNHDAEAEAEFNGPSAAEEDSYDYTADDLNYDAAREASR